MVRYGNSKKRAMKSLNILAWVSGGIGALIIIFAAISVLIGRNLFGFTHLVNFFHAANSFLLVSIALFLADKKAGAEK